MLFCTFVYLTDSKLTKKSFWVISGKQAEYSFLNVPKSNYYIMLWVPHGQTLYILFIFVLLHFLNLRLIPQSLRIGVTGT